MPSGVYKRIEGKIYGTKGKGGYKLSEKAKLNMRVPHNYPKGKKLSDEHKRKLSDVKLKNPPKYWMGKKRPDISLSLMGEKNPFYGKHHSKERCLQMRLNLLGKFGEKSPKYIKDRTKLYKNEKKHLDTQYRCWMVDVKNRDNWKCKINNKDCKGRLESHHILN